MSTIKEAVSNAHYLDVNANALALNTPLAGKTAEIHGKLSNLKERLEGFDGQIVSAADRFKEKAFGSSDVGNGVPGFFEQVAGGGRSKHPLANAALDNFTGGGQGRYSDEPTAGSEGKKSDTFSWSEFFSSIAESIFGSGLPRGAPTSLVTGPGTVETVTGDPADFPRGVKAIVNSGDKNETMKGILDNMDKTPVPDSDAGGPPVITEEVIKAIAARRGTRGEPVDDGSTGKGGAVAVPKTTQQGEWAGDAVSSPVINRVQLNGLEARINAKITIIR